MPEPMLHRNQRRHNWSTSPAPARTSMRTLTQVLGLKLACRRVSSCGVLRAVQVCSANRSQHPHPPTREPCSAAVLIPRHKARPLCLTRLAHPDLAVWMLTAAAGGRNRRVTRAVEQARVRGAAIGVDAAMICDRLVPGRLAPVVDGSIAQRRAIDLALVEIDQDLVAVLDERDRTAERGFRTNVADDEAYRSAREARIRYQRHDNLPIAAERR